MEKEFVILTKNNVGDYTVKFGKKTYQKINTGKVSNLGIEQYKWVRFKTKHIVKQVEAKKLDELLNSILSKTPNKFSGEQKTHDKRLASASTIFHTSEFIIPFGFSSNYNPSPDVINYIKNEQGLMAVKLIKEELGIGLKEAKDIYDVLKQNITNYV